MSKLNGVSKILIISVIAIAPLLLGGTVAAQSTMPAECEVFSLSYSVGKDTVTANFAVRNNNNGEGTCTKEVTVAAWNAPNGTDGAPFSQQTLFDSKSGTFNIGNHSLTVKKPKCFYQVDLLRGLNPNMLGGNSASPNYADWQYVSSAHGGEACKPTPTPQPTPTPMVVPASTKEVTVLPDTGPGEVVAVATALGASAGAAHFVYNRRKIKR